MGAQKKHEYFRRTELKTSLSACPSNLGAPAPMNQIKSTFPPLYVQTAGRGIDQNMYKNCIGGIKQARKTRSYASLKLLPTESLSDGGEVESY